ncbi:hypothetical protein IWQ60_011728 [Tieghemiomyces parasiticus]|uniref:Uncharacterized protein n=1 Tax=Tieghemiomyces parasiticus TaxID=78921 RepID=A0A9W7ZI35_9FUNG|nr:hypothetical protein IWQ60_011728 [Tieghemiomyces parasiticus]
MALTLPSPAAVLRRLGRMSTHIVDDSRYEKILAYLVTDLDTDSVTVGRWLDDEGTFMACQACINSDIDDRICSIALRFLGQLLGTSYRVADRESFTACRATMPDAFTFIQSLLASSDTSARLRYACTQCVCDMVQNPTAAAWFFNWSDSLQAVTLSLSDRSCYTTQATCILIQRLLPVSYTSGGSTAWHQNLADLITEKYLPTREGRGPSRALNSTTMDQFLELLWTLVDSHHPAGVQFIAEHDLFDYQRAFWWLADLPRLPRGKLLSVLHRAACLPRGKAAEAGLSLLGKYAAEEPEEQARKLWNVWVQEPLVTRSSLETYQIVSSLMQVIMTLAHVQGDGPAPTLFRELVCEALTGMVRACAVELGSLPEAATEARSGATPPDDRLIQLLHSPDTSLTAKRTIVASLFDVVITALPEMRDPLTQSNLADTMLGLVRTTSMLLADRRVALRAMELVRVSDTFLDCQETAELTVLALLRHPDCSGFLIQQGFREATHLLRGPAALQARLTRGFAHQLVDSVLGPRLNDDRWEVREACVGFVRDLVRGDPDPAIASVVADHDLVGRILPLATDGEAYVRASVLDAMEAILRPALPQTSSSATVMGYLDRLALLWPATIWTAYVTDTEAFVRRAALNLVADLLIHHPEHPLTYQTLAGLTPPETLRHLIDDGDYEVRLRATAVAYLLWAQPFGQGVNSDVSNYETEQVRPQQPEGLRFQSGSPRLIVSQSPAAVAWPCPYCLNVPSLLLQAAQDPSRFVRARAGRYLESIRDALTPHFTDDVPPGDSAGAQDGPPAAKRSAGPNDPPIRNGEGTAGDSASCPHVGNPAMMPAHTVLAAAHRHFARQLWSVDFERLWATTSSEHLYREAIESGFPIDGESAGMDVDPVDLKMDMAEAEAENSGNNILDCY